MKRDRLPPPRGSQVTRLAGNDHQLDDGFDVGMQVQVDVELANVA